MNENENNWDKLLHIRTSGRDDSNADQYNYPYEPTPYVVLERLAYAGYLGKRNTLIDYGCGKGRVDYFLSYQTRCHSIGIEYDERIYALAMENKKSAAAAGRTEFYMEKAENYVVPEEADRFYFFNPFSPEVLNSVLGQIRKSYYEKPRQMFLMFYYPSDEYVAFLMTTDDLSFLDEVDCSDLFEGANPRERILVFEMGQETGFKK